MALLTSPCTAVISEKCIKKTGDLKDITLAPIFQNSAGQIKFGVQTQVAGAKCFYQSATSDRVNVMHSCTVGPGAFPAEPGVVATPEPTTTLSSGSGFLMR